MSEQLEPRRPLRGTPRIDPGWRGQTRGGKAVWHAPTGAEFHIHIDVRYRTAGVRANLLGIPLEIWLKPSKRAGREGTAFSSQCDDAGISLSLLLQHAHGLADLRARYKPGSLFRWAVEEAWRISVEFGADVPPLPDDLVVSGVTETQG